MRSRTFEKLGSTMSLKKQILMRKRISSIEANSDDFKKTLNAADLTFIGIGGIIGTGIFVLTGMAAANYSGPAIVLSFAIAGVVSALAALCYSEMSSMIPLSGSAYLFTYFTMGEFPAWIIGWDLILEYLVGAATVAVGLSGYIVALFNDMGIHTSKSFTESPFLFDTATQSFEMSGAYFNLPAFAIVLGITGVLMFGVKESARLNSTAVIIKIIVVFLFLGSASFYINKDNYTPFIPPNTGTFGHFGISGIFQGATTVFFAYIGFDAVSTCAQECKNPQRDLPIGIILSLVICTVLYIAVSFVLTGVVPYTELNVPMPISVGIAKTGLHWLTLVVDLGAVAGLSSVLLVNLMAQPRIFYSMALDGLLPPIFAKMHPVHKTPYVATFTTGILCAVLAALFPIDVLGELTSIGTLFAFVLVSLAVMILRIKKPDLPRKFKVPFGPYFIPILSALASAGLIGTATPSAILRLFVWMVVGAVIYFCYGKKNSVLKREMEGISEENIEMQETQASTPAVEDTHILDAPQQ